MKFIQKYINTYCTTDVNKELILNLLLHEISLSSNIEALLLLYNGILIWEILKVYSM